MLCCFVVVVRMQSASWRLCWTWRTAVLTCLSCLFLLCSTFLPKEEQRSLKGFNSLGMWRWVAGLVLPDVSKERIDCMDCSVRQDIGIHCPTTLPHIRTPESSATPRSRIGLQVYLAACAHWCACVSHIDFSYSHLFFTNLGINTCHWRPSNTVFVELSCQCCWRRCIDWSIATFRRHCDFWNVGKYSLNDTTFSSKILLFVIFNFLQRGITTWRTCELIWRSPS